MSSPRCLTICLLLAPTALAGGCGSGESTSTHTTAGVTAATTGAPALVGPQTAGQGAGSTGAEQTSTTPAPRAKRATPTTKAPPSQTSAQAATPKITTIPKVKFTPPKHKPKVTPQYSEGHIVRPVPPGLRHEFPLELQKGFLEVWEAANGSKSSAECVIEKYEARNIAEEIALAEMVGVQTAVLDHLQAQLPRRALQYLRECHSGALT